MTNLLYRPQMKTSSRIALQFTLWVAIISGILLAILNTVFMYWWVRSERQNVTQFVVLKNIQPRNPYTDTLQRQERVMAFPDIAFSPHDFPSFWGIKRLRLFDWRRWIVGKSANYFVLFDVSQNINRQIWLLSISTISWLSVVFCSFIFWRFFVEYSLRDLRILSKRVGKRDVSKANWWLTFSHLPEYDEINNIAKSIETLESRIQWYYSNLRHFVWNVSHELKTPLMVMKSEIDITKRTLEYEWFVKKIEENILSMQNMIDTLLMLTRLQSQEAVEKTSVALEEIIKDGVDQQKKKHSSKPMQVHTKWLENIYIDWNEQLMKIMLNNIIDNAWKYSPEHTRITISYEDDSLKIENAWSISQDIIENMRTPFWQADKNRWDGAWIWLSLVKEIVRLHGWHIAYTSESENVVCKISFIY